ncbi:MAG: hypothetical protein Ta2B_11050 [Termitinemataceae bacterium]|nr:MAG: hypothetical protein Ta2B_11050 [Termitinemataceae bacterium]
MPLISAIKDYIKTGINQVGDFSGQNQAMKLFEKSTTERNAIHKYEYYITLEHIQKQLDVHFVVFAIIRRPLFGRPAVKSLVYNDLHF